MKKALQRAGVRGMQRRGGGEAEGMEWGRGEQVSLYFNGITSLLSEHTKSYSVETSALSAAHIVKSFWGDEGLL